MNRSLLKRVFPQSLAWAAVVALCGTLALAQDNTVPAPAQRTDGQIEMDVVHALDASKSLKKDLITAATIQGEVTLSGTVASEASSELAETIASRVQGVTAVHNNLKVGNPQETQAAQAGVPDTGADPAAENQAQPDDGPMPPPQGLPQRAPGDKQAPYPPVRPQYAPVRPPVPVYKAATGPVTIPEGTLLQMRTNEPVATRYAKEGTPLDFTVIHDVAIGGVLAIPRGATVHGIVTESKKAGDLGGAAELALKLVSLDLGGQNYPLDSDQFKVKGPNKAGHTVGNAIGGGILGTIIGCAVGRGVGCAVGAGAGIAAGTAASAASPGPGVWIPTEALVDFHLKMPVTVNPVDQQEAARLAQGLYQGGPTLYRRQYSPYGGVYAAGYPYYGYPPVFYRPYYTIGGYYYWR